MKKIKLASGKTIEADWVFVSIGNTANSELVQEADQGALVDGMGKMIDVDDFLKVCDDHVASGV
jgi:thioredoxin reductase